MGSGSGGVLALLVLPLWVLPKQSARLAQSSPCARYSPCTRNLQLWISDLTSLLSQQTVWRGRKGASVVCDTALLVGAVPTKCRMNGSGLHTTASRASAMPCFQLLPAPDPLLLPRGCC